MNRRRAIQVFAAASFVSAVAQKGAVGCAPMAANAPERTSDENLLNLLRLVSQAAEECDRSSFRVKLPSSSLQTAIRDATFFSREATRRLRFSDEKSPAFWQTCTDRLKNALAMLESTGSQQICRMDLATALTNCLPALEPTLVKSLA